MVFLSRQKPGAPGFSPDRKAQLGSPNPTDNSAIGSIQARVHGEPMVFLRPGMDDRVTPIEGPWRPERERERRLSASDDASRLNPPLLLLLCLDSKRALPGLETTVQAASYEAHLHQIQRDGAYQPRAFGPLWAEHTRRVNYLEEAETPDGDRIAARLRNCCRHPLLVAYGDGLHYHLTEQRCRSRVCPRCARLRARALAFRIATLVRRMDSPRFLTLTIRSNDRPLREQVKHLRRRFAALRRRSDWPTHVVGGVYTLEITFNTTTQQWHPHLHAIVDGTYWAHADLLSTWETVVGDHAGVDIRAVHGVRKLANYLACYVAKSCDLRTLEPRQLAEWAIETHGLRLAQTFGSLQGCKPQTGDEAELDPLPTRIVDLNVHHLAWDAARGNPRAERLLRLIEPHRRPAPIEDPAATLAAIHAYNRPHLIPHGPEPPPPRDRDADQLRFSINGQPA